MLPTLLGLYIRKYPTVTYLTNHHFAQHSHSHFHITLSSASAIIHINSKCAASSTLYPSYLPIFATISEDHGIMALPSLRRTMLAICIVFLAMQCAVAQIVAPTNDTSGTNMTTQFTLDTILQMQAEHYPVVPLTNPAGVSQNLQQLKVCPHVHRLRCLDCSLYMLVGNRSEGPIFPHKCIVCGRPRSWKYRLHQL